MAPLPLPRLPAFALLALGVLACSSPKPNVVLRASLDGASLPGLDVQVIPFDPDALLDSLGRAAGHEHRRPDYGPLEQELLAYHRPDQRVVAGRDTTWLATRDSADRLADSLRRLNPRGAGYPAAYARFRALYDRMLRRLQARDGGRSALPAADRQLAVQAAAAADVVRAWEDLAYADYPALAQARLAASRRDVVTTTTDSAGRSDLELAPGSWWIIARLADPANPFAEWRWRASMVVPRWSRLTVPLFDGNASRAWRH